MIRAAALLALAAAAAATAAAPTYLSPDSQHYLDVARSLEAGLGPVSFHLHLASPGVPAATGLWPSGYPAALALLGRAGLDGAHAPAALNGAALFALALALYALGRLAGLPDWLAVLAAAAASAHPALRHALGHTWSEPAFLALTFAALALLAAALLRERPGLALAAGGCAGLAFAVRYTGLFLVGFLLAAAAAHGLARRWPPRRHLLHAALLLAGPALAAPLAVAANLQAYGRPFGLPRIPVPGLGPALASRAQELLTSIEGLLQGWGALALLAGLLLAWRGPPAGEPGAAPPPTPAGGRLVGALLGGWSAWYVAALFASVAGIVTDPLDLRLLAPVLPALALAGFLLAGRPLATLRAGPTLAAAGLALALAGHAGAAWQRHLDPPVPETSPELAALAQRRAGPTTLFVASRGWGLRHATGAIVLEDGYPDMAPLEPVPVFRFLDGPGRGFERAVLVFRPDGDLPPERLPSFLREAGRAGWRGEPPEQAGDATVVGLTRAAGPRS